MVIHGPCCLLALALSISCLASLCCIASAHLETEQRTQVGLWVTK